MADDVRIVFTASQTWFGKAIRWFTKSSVSHVYVEFPVWGRQMALEATVGGTRMVLAGKSRHNVVAEFAVTTPSRDALIAMMPHLGTPYDYSSILFLAWVQISWNWFKTKTRSAWWSTKALRCSELAVYFLRALKVDHEAEEMDAELSTPDDIMNYCLGKAPSIALIE